MASGAAGAKGAAKGSEEAASREQERLLLESLIGGDGDDDDTDHDDDDGDDRDDDNDHDGDDRNDGGDVSPAEAVLRERSNAARQRAFGLWCSPVLQQTREVILREVSSGSLAARAERQLHSDLSLQRAVADTLLQYHPSWLRLALETMTGRRVRFTRASLADGGAAALRAFIARHVLGPDSAIEQRFRDTVKGVFDEEHARAQAAAGLARVLTLVHFLDAAHCQDVMRGAASPRLFRTGGECKSTADVVVALGRDLLARESNPLEHVRRLGVSVTVEQKPVDEADVAVRDFATDLRDGVVLCRFLEALAGLRPLSTGRELPRFPAVTAMNRESNIRAFLALLQRVGLRAPAVATHKAIAAGDVPATVALVWAMVSAFGLPCLAPPEAIGAELAELADGWPAARATMERFAARRGGRSWGAADGSAPAQGVDDEAAAEEDAAAARAMDSSELAAAVLAACGADGEALAAEDGAAGGAASDRSLAAGERALAVWVAVAAAAVSGVAPSAPHDDAYAWGRDLSDGAALCAVVRLYRPWMEGVALQGATAAGTSTAPLREGGELGVAGPAARRGAALTEPGRLDGQQRRGLPSGAWAAAVGAERCQMLAACEAASQLGGVPLVLPAASSETPVDARVMAVFAAHLFATLVASDASREHRAARVLQRAVRRVLLLPGRLTLLAAAGRLRGRLAAKTSAEARAASAIARACRSTLAHWRELEAAAVAEAKEAAVWALVRAVRVKRTMMVLEERALVRRIAANGLIAFHRTADRAALARAEEAEAEAEEAARLAQEQAEAEEAARLAQEQAKAEAEEAARLAQEQAKAEAEEAARLAQEQAKAEAEEAARLAQEQAEAEEAARLAQEQAEAEAEEAARLAQEQAKAEAEEAARLAQEQAEAEAEEAARLAQAKAEAEEAARLAQAKAEAEEAARLAQAKVEAEEAARLAQAKVEAEAEEAARLAQEQAKAEAEEAARLAQEQAKAEAEEAARLAQAKVEAEEAARLAQAKAEAEAEEAARLAQAKAEAEEAARLAQEQAKAEAEEAARLAQEQAKAEAEEAARLAQEQAKAEAEEAARLAQEQAEAEAEEAARLAQEQAKAEAEEAARLAQEQAEAEEAARLAQEQAKAEAEEAARLAQEQAKAEAEEAARLAQEQAKAEAEEAARLAQEQAKAEAEEAARLAQEQAEAEEAARLAQEQAKAEAEEAAAVLRLAVMLQSLWRGYLARVACQVLLAEIVALQAAVRGYQWRQRLRSLHKRMTTLKRRWALRRAVRALRDEDKLEPAHAAACAAAEPASEPEAAASEPCSPAQSASPFQASSPLCTDVSPLVRRAQAAAAAAQAASARCSPDFERSPSVTPLKDSNAAAASAASSPASEFPTLASPAAPVPDSQQRRLVDAVRTADTFGKGQVAASALGAFAEESERNSVLLARAGAVPALLALLRSCGRTEAHASVMLACLDALCSLVGRRDELTTMALVHAKEAPQVIVGTIEMFRDRRAVAARAVRLLSVLVRTADGRSKLARRPELLSRLSKACSACRKAAKRARGSRVEDAQATARELTELAARLQRQLGGRA
ncbi:hypothetical protein FNF31_03361 [Cafeteria roenbergensis]|uniref:Calponin-homology (CH) domain-containing protein n=1 Tax=Cafeteria roenbergensis TaxID=33653 RepID=A0A5A8DBN7_CAFRO|nr:hypothetical protein FNF31_03361 [Cafeteria roenbergensis]